jgi:hypothetical protein
MGVARMPPYPYLAWEALVAALRKSSLRSDGPSAWAAPVSDDPLVFILDAIDEALNLWDAGGNLLYRNRAAASLDLPFPGETRLDIIDVHGRAMRRRCVRFTTGGTDLLLEIVHTTGATEAIREIDRPVFPRISASA